jgi:hypothetical protein
MNDLPTPARETQNPLRPFWVRGSLSRQRPSIGFRSIQRLCDTAAAATAAAFAVPIRDLIAPTRCAATTAFARQSAMYLARVAFDLSFSDIGRAFGRDRTTAAHACQLVEDRRDDPAIDAVLGSLESACAVLRRRLAAPMQP